MKKDAYFFPHFCNARHDRKVKRIIKELGVEGYGIYFMLLEVLREQSDFKFPLDDLDLLADEFGTSEQKVRTVVCNYHLFDVDDEQRFFSLKLIFYLQPYIEKTERARAAANLRWDKVREINNPDANAYANALQMQCVGNASAMQGEERIGEERIGKDKPLCPYRDLYDYYLSLGLKNHRAYTDEMRDTMKRATEILKCDTAHLMLLLDRHKQVVDMTKTDAYPVPPRGLTEFFGQRAYQAKHLICSEYDEGGAKYEKYLVDTMPVFTRQPETAEVVDEEKLRAIREGL